MSQCGTISDTHYNSFSLSFFAKSPKEGQIKRLQGIFWVSTHRGTQLRFTFSCQSGIIDFHFNALQYSDICWYFFSRFNFDNISTNQFRSQNDLSFSFSNNLAILRKETFKGQHKSLACCILLECNSCCQKYHETYYKA